MNEEKDIKLIVKRLSCKYNVKEKIIYLMIIIAEHYSYSIDEIENLIDKYFLARKK